jgi:hypothetical protein
MYVVVNLQLNSIQSNSTSSRTCLYYGMSGGWGMYLVCGCQFTIQFNSMVLRVRTRAIQWYSEYSSTRVRTQILGVSEELIRKYVHVYTYRYTRVRVCTRVHVYSSTSTRVRTPRGDTINNLLYLPLRARVPIVPIGTRVRTSTRVNVRVPGTRVRTRTRACTRTTIVATGYTCTS